MKKQIIFFGLMLVATMMTSQSTWKPLVNSPSGIRNDDMFFIDSLRGWVVNGIGTIHHTNDGGQSWIKQLETGEYFRSVAFLNDKIGFAGTLNGTFYKTTNGGQTWVDIAATITPKPPGICGIHIVDSMVTYAVGIWSKPGYILKTVDGGANWTTTVLGQALVDVYFVNQDTGFVTGQDGNGAAIYYTTNGGSTWTQKYNSGVSGQYVWKIQQVTQSAWVGSVQTFNGGQFVKSSDGGQTWISKSAPVPDMQGIGFLTPDHGWVGGYVSGFWETLDGGDNWTYFNIGGNYNRFQFLSPTLGYASGDGVYKYDMSSSSIPPTAYKSKDDGFKINISPNPNNGQFMVSGFLPVSDVVRVDILTANGTAIKPVFNQRLAPGQFSFIVSAADLPADAYWLGIQRNHGLYTKAWIKQ